MGSYQIEIVTVGPILSYRDYRVHSDGRRELLHAATAFREVRLNDFQKDVDARKVVLRT